MSASAEGPSALERIKIVNPSEREIMKEITKVVSKFIRWFVSRKSFAKFISIISRK